MKARLLVALLFSQSLAAQTQIPDLPPTVMVMNILRQAPQVQAASSLVRAEEANRQRLEAGSHEWAIKLGSQRRRVVQPASAEQQYREWDASLERAIRLPGKASTDAALGAQGVALAENALGDARHETSRALLKHWFTWLKERETARQWAEQVTLLEKQAKALQRRQQLGDASRLDAVQGEAALAQALSQLAQAKVRQRTAEEELRRRYPGLALPAQISPSQPKPLEGDEDTWITAILEESHELGLARGESLRAQTLATRSSQERLPDPTFGLQSARERSGEERVLGAYISIPLPGTARRASADAALAHADAATRREAAALQKITVEAASLYQTTAAAYESWQSSAQAAESLTRAADMTARAYQLGEGTLSDLLTTRRLANEGQLAAKLMQLEALELHYRLMLDAHKLWDLDHD